MEPIIFRFNCVFCGAHPEPRPFSDYLAQWRTSPESDFDVLLARYGQILLAIRRGQSRWLTKKFGVAADRVLQWFVNAPSGESPNRIEDGRLIAVTSCPVCRTEAGQRPEDRYFTEWAHACRVQAANFLYEAGIIIFSVLQALPRWAIPERMGQYGDLLFLNQKALAALSLLDCPYCGRKTTCLYGDGSPGNPHRCRWCLDASGAGAFAAMTIGIDEDGSVALKIVEPGLPTKISGTLVPWLIKARIKGRKAKKP